MLPSIPRKLMSCRSIYLFEGGGVPPYLKLGACHATPLKLPLSFSVNGDIAVLRFTSGVGSDIAAATQHLSRA